MLHGLFSWQSVFGAQAHFGDRMEECELCGKQTDEIYVVSVEDVELRVCSSCAKGKIVVSKPSQQKKQKPFISERKAAAKDDELELIENYGKAISAARNAMKLPIKTLAEMINEKEAFLVRVEAEKTTPPAKLVKKLEKALGIKLYANAKAEPQEHASKKPQTATLSDYLEPKE